jgi:hypothetical protein
LGSVSGLIGYRFMRLHDALSINGTSVPDAGGSDARRNRGRRVGSAIVATAINSL